MIFGKLVFIPARRKAKTTDLPIRSILVPCLSDTVVINASCSIVRPCLSRRVASAFTPSRVTLFITVRCQIASSTFVACVPRSRCKPIGNHPRKPSPVHFMNFPPAALIAIRPSQCTLGRYSSIASTDSLSFRNLDESLISQTQTTPRPRSNENLVSSILLLNPALPPVPYQTLVSKFRKQAPIVRIDQPNVSIAVQMIAVRINVSDTPDPPDRLE